MRAPILVAVVAAAVPTVAAQQTVELDRTLQRVYGTTVMSSDVRQARMLRLVPESGADDVAIQTALENRLLILHELARVTLPEPAPAAIAARRASWTAGFPASADVPALLSRAAMSDPALDAWFQADLRIAAYLEQRFGGQRDEARAKRIADWIVDLRRRANLTGRQP